MKNSQNDNNASKLGAFIDFQISPQEQRKVAGGFLFRMLDDFRCNIDRVFGRGPRNGGNGDGDW